MSEKTRAPKWLLYIFCVLTVASGIVFLALRAFPAGWTRPKDAQIVSAISQARTVMTYLHYSEGNYDNFNCKYRDMVALCENIDKNYRKEDVNEPIIAHGASRNSQSACIYSPLNAKDKYWYCVDSKGNAVFTEIDPAGNGYCVEGKSAVCPPALKGIP